MKAEAHQPAFAICLQADGGPRVNRSQERADAQIARALVDPTRLAVSRNWPLD